MNERHPLMQSTTTTVATSRSREQVRDGMPVNAIVVDSMTFHPDDFHEAKISLGDEIEARLYRECFAAVKIGASEYVPRDHVLLQDALGQFRELKRFR
jgi:hypothetical protein